MGALKNAFGGFMKKEVLGTDMIKVNKIADLLMKKKNIVMVVGG